MPSEIYVHEIMQFWSSATWCMMENADSVPPDVLKRKTETGLPSAISVEFKFNFIMEFCIAEQ